MKKIILGVLFSIGLVLGGCATTQNPPSAPAKFEKIYAIDGLNQSQIYDGARQWFAIAFRSANAVIQYEDKATGTIIGKGNMQYPCTGFECMGMTGKEHVDFTVRVDTKDGKIRVGYEDLVYSAPAHLNSGILMPAVSYPIRDTSKSKTAVIAKLDILSSEMVGKIKSQQKVNSDW
ncbi:DUF4468 domain-containing protein [Acinetobacter brisouii]|uniref:DUF4468 domain-containing protein n=1 Tax=Acinetobacter brisouii TaxID=396323 RepID=UPI0005F79F4A|nr:DUF4468 domain-containing protein [Acinetobacter brisouii]KJV38185.1 hypothetical protein VH98_10015 [Acinetobacter brisouii]